MMSKNEKEQKGFSLLYIALVVVIVTVISGAGWYAWNSNRKTNTTVDKSKIVVAENTSPSVQESNSSDGKNTFGLTKTDKANISRAVLSWCGNINPNTTYKLTGEDNLDNGRSTSVKENFIIVNLQCYDNSLASDEQGSGQQFLIKKLSDNEWKVITAEQMAPACTKVDGNDIPAGFIKCSDENDQLRDPK